MKKSLVILILLSSYNLCGQSLFQEDELKTAWSSCIEPLIKNDLKKMEQSISFPLAGDWGYMMELNKKFKDWSKSDFLENYNKLFDTEMLNKLNMTSYKDFEVSKLEDGKIQLELGIGFVTWIDDFKDESGVRFIFRKQNNQWRLYAIYGVG